MSCIPLRGGRGAARWLYAFACRRAAGHELTQALFQMAAHLGLAGPIGADQFDHEFLAQYRLRQVFLFGDHLQQDAARDVGVVLLVDDDEVDLGRRPGA